MSSILSMWKEDEDLDGVHRFLSHWLGEVPEFLARELGGGATLKFVGKTGNFTPYTLLLNTPLGGVKNSFFTSFEGMGTHILRRFSKGLQYFSHIFFKLFKNNFEWNPSPLLKTQFLEGYTQIMNCPYYAIPENTFLWTLVWVCPHICTVSGVFNNACDILKCRITFLLKIFDLRNIFQKLSSFAQIRR